IGAGKMAGDAACLQYLLQPPRLFIPAHYAEKRSRDTQRREVHGNVGGTAGPVVAAAHVHYRHRRLRRYPAGATEEVTIEHHIAGDEDAGTREIRDGQSHGGNTTTRSAGRRMEHGAPGEMRGLTGSCGGRPQDSAWRGALRVAGHPHFESPQLRQVMQPSIMITAAVLHLAQSWAPSGYSLFENASCCFAAASNSARFCSMSFLCSSFSSGFASRPIMMRCFSTI